jgi:hypothetical protein
MRLTDSEEPRKTMTREGKMNTYRTTAKIVGVIFLAGMVIGIGGNILILSLLGGPGYLAALSANSMLLAIGAGLWLMTVVGDAAHGVLMFPILKQQHSERIAVGYLAARIVDAVFIAVMVLFILLQIPLASEYLKAGGSDASYLQALSTMFVQVNIYAYHIAMFTLGIAGLLLCYTFYRAKIRDQSLRVPVRSLGGQPALDPRDSGWPMGAVHRGVAYR